MTDTLFENRYVFIDSVPTVRSDGEKYDHMRIKTGTGFGGLTIPITYKNDELHFGLVIQHRPVIGVSSIEFPRGGTEDLSEEEALRELKEETTLINYKEVKKIGELYIDTGSLNNELAVVLVSIDESDSIVEDDWVEDESGATFVWVSHNDFKQMIKNGEIKCCMTIAAYSMFLLESVDGKDD